MGEKHSISVIAFLYTLDSELIVFKIKTIWEREKCFFIYNSIYVSLYITQPTKMLLALALGNMKTISSALTFKALFGM